MKIESIDSTRGDADYRYSIMFIYMRARSEEKTFTDDAKLLIKVKSVRILEILEAFCWLRIASTYLSHTTS